MKKNKSTTERRISSLKRQKHLCLGFLSDFIFFSIPVILLIIFSTPGLAQTPNNNLSDTGNVGIGTINPVEKFEVQGNSVLRGKVSVTDSMTIGNNVNVQSSMRIADTLNVGSTIRVVRIEDVQSLSSEKIETGTIGSSTGEITIAGREDIVDPGTGVPCDALVLNYCNRTIYGYFKNSSTGVETYPGVSIGKLSSASAQHSVSLGRENMSLGVGSIAVGQRVRPMAENSMVIGSAPSTGAMTYFSNNTANSLMIGFNTTLPSIFVGPSTIAPNFCGNVGIGNKTPSDLFHVGSGLMGTCFGSAFNNGAGYFITYMGSNAARTRTDNHQTSSWTISGAEGTNGASILATDAGGNMVFIPIKKTDASNTYSLSDADIKAHRVMLLEPGTINPQTQKLEGALMRLNGKIYCKEVEVKIDPTAWWDDVFAEGYNLRAIVELEEYINTHKHLPDVPSEQEVIEKGLPVGEGYGMLLRKIEELTLYMIELKKENEEMKKALEVEKNHIR